MELKALRRLGWTVSAMAREFGLSRTTIYKELASDGTRRYGPRPRPMSLNEAQRVHVERRLVVCPGIRGTDLHAELRSAYGYEGSYPAFERQLRLLRPAVVRDPEIRFETAPGIQTQGDWAHMGLWPLGDRMVELYAMVAILGFSRAPAIRFATDLTRPTSLREAQPTRSRYDDLVNLSNYICNHVKCEYIRPKRVQTAVRRQERSVSDLPTRAAISRPPEE